MANLLQNPGFEGGWTRKTYTGQEFGEIFVPEDWVAFWKEGPPVPHDPSNTNGYGRPEMHVINREPPFLDPPRVRSGNRALKFFTFYRIHDAGVFQQVANIEPGMRLRATGWAHAWSSTQDNPRASEGVGDQPFFVRVADYGNDDGVRNFVFRVGLDPRGGTNPWSTSVVWGEGAHIYNGFAQIPPLEAVAQSTTVTVFVRSSVLWPFKHCDAYLDDMLLVPVATPAAPIEISITPQRVVAGEPFEVSVTGGASPQTLSIKVAGDAVFQKETLISDCAATCRCVALEPGAYEVRVSAVGEGTKQVPLKVHPRPAQPGPGLVPPREPYERTYLLLPPGAGDPWLEAVLASGVWERHRWTIGGSADDAGMGPAGRRVIAVNPELWPGDLHVFFAQYYPGLTYQVVRVATPEALQEALSHLD